MCFCCHETEALLSKILKPISLSLVTAELYINKGVFDCFLSVFYVGLCYTYSKQSQTIKCKLLVAT